MEQEFSRSEGVKFMKSEGQNPVLGHWTKQEHYVFLGILQCCHIQSGSITTEEFSKVVSSCRHWYTTGYSNTTVTEDTYTNKSQAAALL